VAVVSPSFNQEVDNLQSVAMQGLLRSAELKHILLNPHSISWEA
jgi:hypothetical protein